MKSSVDGCVKLEIPRRQTRESQMQVCLECDIMSYYAEGFEI